jgi:hypothetical protein
VLFEGDNPLSRTRITEEVFKSAVGDPSTTHQRFGWSATTEIGAGIASVYVDAQRRLRAANTA